MRVGAIDLGILIVYLMGVVALGLWIGRKTGSVSDFVVGGRDRPWWLILFSIVATETSTVMPRPCFATKSRALAAFWSMDTAITRAPACFQFSFQRSRIGNSRRHGAHQLAQKLTTRTSPS